MRDQPSGSAECREALDDKPLRQGDVFRWVADVDDGVWLHAGVVITADCDLALNKTYGRLSFVPLLPEAEFYWNFWRPGKFGPILEKLLATGAQRASKQLSKRDGVERSISPNGLADWIDRAGPRAVAVECAGENRSLVPTLVNVFEPVERVSKLLQAQSPNWDALRNALPLRKPTHSPDTYEGIAAEFKDVVTSLPGDVFFLSEVPGALPGGYFAMLRYVSQCALEDVRISAETLRFEGGRARRISRIPAPFLYSLTQGIGRVFSDIGLPESYEERRKRSPLEMIRRIEACK